MEVGSGVGTPHSLKGGDSLDSGTVWVYGVVFGWGPDWSGPVSLVSMGVVPPCFWQLRHYRRAPFQWPSAPLPGPERSFGTTPQCHPWQVAEKLGEAFSLSIISGAKEFP